MLGQQPATITDMIMCQCLASHDKVLSGKEAYTFILIGLDATASLQLLKHLDKLADSNRTVILTIHQPRMEIFGMFNQLVLLSDGKVRLKALLIMIAFSPYLSTKMVLSIGGRWVEE